MQKPQWGQNVFEIWVWIFTPVNFMRNFGSAVEASASAVAVYVYDSSYTLHAWEIWNEFLKNIAMVQQKVYKIDP